VEDFDFTYIYEIGDDLESEGDFCVVLALICYTLLNTEPSYEVKNYIKNKLSYTAGLDIIPAVYLLGIFLTYDKDFRNK
jgi:hypothetical protein